MRSFDVSVKGVVVVPNATRWTGPWLGATRAASLQRVANRPIVCHVLDELRAAGVREAAVLAPPEVSEEIAACVSQERPAGIRVRHLTHEGDGDLDALLSITKFVGGDPCIMHRADGLLGQPLSPFVELLDGESSDALLLVREDGRERKRLRLVTRRLLTPAEEDKSMAPTGIAGVCLLAPGALERLMAERQAPETLVEFTALAERLALAGGRVHIHAVRKWRHFAGEGLDLLDMNRTMLDALDSEASASLGSGNRFEGHIEIHPSASVTLSVIIGPVIVGADALIADSYIGPHTAIAERVRIEGAELERSIVLADASVLHVGGRLVASIVGREARVFRDFSVPRALRLQVGDGDEVALC